EGDWRTPLPGLLHELQPQPAEQSLARRDRVGREIPERRGIYNQPAARLVLRVERNHGPYCKIKVREDGYGRIPAITHAELPHRAGGCSGFDSGVWAAVWRRREPGSLYPHSPAPR